MNGDRIALDTNVAIALLNDAAEAGRWLADVDSIALPVPVVGELRFGALNSSRSEENLSSVTAFVDRSLVLCADAATAAVYAEVRMHLKRVGKPIPENDLWIAAICIQHGPPLASTDAHFAEVEGLRLKRD